MPAGGHVRLRRGAGAVRQGRESQAETALSNVNGIQTAIAGQDFQTAAKNASNLQSSAQAMNEELSSPVWDVAAMLPSWAAT